MSWISKSIIYQINLRSLAAREPRNPFEAMSEKADGESPIAYITRHLPKLKRLGANVLYLMPPYPMGMIGRKGIGSPYSIRDFCDVDPEFGTVAELAAFVRRAHTLGFRVILDITPNHTSRDNRWTKEHPEYYFPDAAGNLRFDWDWSDTAKLNYGHPGLRQAMQAVLNFWLEFLGQREGVDGFRFDMAHIISDLSFWNEAFAALRASYPGRELLFMAESYGARNNLDLFARGMNAAYDDDLYKVCQYLYAVDERGQTVVNLAPEAANNGDFADKLEAFRREGLAGAVECALQRYESVLPPDPQGPWLARYTDNHDEGRGVYRFGEGGVRAIMQLVFLTGHTLPFLLDGQEFGALNRPPIHARLGICDKGYRLVKEGGVRTHDGVEFEGNLFARGHAARQEWFQFYCELIALRKKHAALTHGKFALLEVGEACECRDRTVIAFQRVVGKTRLNCAVNLGAEQRKLAQSGMFKGTALYGGLVDDELAPFSAVVVRER